MKATGLSIDPNMGIDTTACGGDQWKEVNIVTEWALINYESYIPLTVRERIKEKAKTARIPIPGGYVQSNDKPQKIEKPLGKGQQLNLF
jgi:hypothetical protein